MIELKETNIVDEKVIYDRKASHRIRYIFREALVILREREENPRRPIEWHKMDWRINEMKPMADIALEGTDPEISVPAELHENFRYQLDEALKIGWDRLKTKNIYYIETQDLVRRANKERLSFRKLAPNYIPA
ncbi:hypothetical protein [Methylobacterium sp. P1-11]|uniref:hypothetical protein n=1 Tax=Methylobacterium sp. P1-11 TaxID=2024616 RepID=UPI0011EF6639|nr:hypothetical protein [Methylobacterium sp. P1-11]